MNDDIEAELPKSKVNFLLRLKANQLENVLFAKLKSYNEIDGLSFTNNNVIFDECDRLPNRLVITTFDLFCYSFSIFTYVMDVFLDVAMAYLHYRNGKRLAATLIIAFVIVPSFIINIIAAIWWIDDESIKNKRKLQSTLDTDKSIPNNCTRKQNFKKFFNVFSLKMYSCFFQLGPILSYIQVIRFAHRYRQILKTSDKFDLSKTLEYYCRLAEAERDATLLRFLESFLESIPQLLLQGYLVAQNFEIVFSSNANLNAYDKEKLQFQVKFQLISIMFSLLSASWSIVVQHKSLRVTLSSKQNLGYYDSLLQLIWRMFTIGSRYIGLLMFLIAFPRQFYLFVLIHFLISLVHILILQNIQFDSSFPCFDKLLIIINAVIHLFLPFNMTEGSTRFQYCTVYFIEFLENVILSWVYVTTDSFKFPFKFHISIFSFFLFFIGITFMITYYSFFHPNIQQQLSTCPKSSGLININKTKKIVSNTASF